MIGKISNEFDYWFMFIIHPGVEAANNRTERSLRPQVVLRKIMGTLRNERDFYSRADHDDTENLGTERIE